MTINKLICLKPNNKFLKNFKPIFRQGDVILLLYDCTSEKFIREWSKRIPLKPDESKILYLEETLICLTSRNYM